MCNRFVFMPFKEDSKAWKQEYIWTLGHRNLCQRYLYHFNVLVLVSITKNKRVAWLLGYSLVFSLGGMTKFTDNFHFLKPAYIPRPTLRLMAMLELINLLVNLFIFHS